MKTNYRFLWILGAMMLLLSWIVPQIEHSNNTFHQSLWIMGMIAVFIVGAYFLNKSD